MTALPTTKTETKTKEPLVDQKDDVHVRNFLLVKAEATRIFNYMTFLNDVLWKTHKEEGGDLLSMADVIRINTITVYMMRLHSAAEPIRKRFSDQVVAKFQHHMHAFVILSGKLNATPEFVAAQTDFVSKTDMMVFLTRVKKRKEYLKSWLSKIQGCLDHLRDLYAAGGDQDAKAYAEEYKGVQALAKQHIWPKLWKLTHKQATAIQDKTLALQLALEKAAVISLGLEQRKVQWTQYLDAFAKL